MGKKYCFVSTGKILRGRKLKFMFGSVFAYVLVLGGLGEGRGGGGGREEGLLLLRPHREFSGVTILGSLFPQLSTLWFHWEGNIYFSCAFPPTFHFRHKCC